MKKTDIVVIGAGVAGLSAAGYGARAGREVLIVEKLAEGGQLMLIDKIVNYPGIDDISGYELTERMRRQTLEFGAKVISGELVSIEKKDNLFTVHLNNEEIEAKAVIIATGARHRHLNIEGEEKYNGRGVSYCGTCDGPFFRNKKIFVIGGGDTALTDALYLSKLTDDITIVHRRDRFRAQNDLIKQVEASHIKKLMNFKPIEIEGDGNKVTGIELESTVNKHFEVFKTDAVFIFAGMLPATGALDKKLLDEFGYVNANANMETAIDGIFVAGDVRNTPFRQIVTAASDGAIAAHVASEYIDKIDGMAYDK